MWLWAKGPKENRKALKEANYLKGLILSINHRFLYHYLLAHALEY